MVFVERPRQLSRPEALAVARAFAADQSGVLGRGQLVRAGVPRWVVQAEVRVGRWWRTGRQTLAVHRGPLDLRARCWVAVLEVGARAAIDGVTVLQLAGCALDDSVITVITPKGSRPGRPHGVRVRESRRYRADDVAAVGLPRIRPAVAAVHAALDARTDREASYFLLLVVQRRLASVAEVHDAVAAVRRHRRRRVLVGLVADLAGGVQSLGELDVARDFRSRGLPEPDRQVLRRRPSGTEYLDVELSAYRLSLEIDGAGHDDPMQSLSDLVRDITTAALGGTAIRIPIATYGLDRDRVIDDLAELLRARGWADPRAA